VSHLEPGRLGRGFRSTGASPTLILGGQAIRDLRSTRLARFRARTGLETAAVEPFTGWRKVKKVFKQLMPMVRTTCPIGRRGRAALLAVLTATTAGCYRYSPISVDSLLEGQTVRMELSAVAVDRVRQGGPDATKLLEGFLVNGTVSRLASDSFFVSVESSLLDAGVRARTVTHDLSLHRTDVQRATLRQLDRKRTTWTSVALGAVAIGSATFALRRGGRSGGTTPSPPGPPEMRIPFSLSWLIR
jgi:hypothetical protein